MELSVLLAVLAFLQTLPPLVSPAAPQMPSLDRVPPAPTLSLSPPCPVRGQRVRLICSPRKGSQALQFLFYELQSSRNWTMMMTQNTNAWEIPREEPRHSRTFYCAYSIRGGPQKQIQSQQSNTVTLTLLGVPGLSLDPSHPVYVQGEQIALQCSAPKDQEALGYRFYKRRPDQISEELPAMGTGPYHRLTAGSQSAGTYTCTYWTLQLGCEIPSSDSNTVSITVTNQPSVPQLSASPQLPVYSYGGSVTLNCSAPGDTVASIYQFLKDGGSLSSASRNHHHLPALQPGDGGKYSCRYGRLESGREIWSVYSNVVSIAVLAPSHGWDSSEGAGLEVRTEEPTPIRATVFRSIFWGWRLAVGGSFFLINALIFLITHRCLKVKGREGAGTPASSIVDPKVCWSC